MKIMLTGWLGTGCTEVANILAKKKNLLVVNSSRAIKDLVGERAQTFQLFEKESRSGEYDLDILLRNKILEYLDQQEAIIIEGRCGLLVLDHDFDVKAFLTGTKEDRTERIASRRSIEKEQAEKIVEKSDKDRRNVVKKLFDSALELSQFDIVLNTSTYSYEQIAGMLLGLLEKRGAGTA